MCTYMYILVYIHMHTRYILDYMYICLHADMCTHINVNMYICMYVYRLSIYVYMYICIYTYRGV